MKAVTISLLLLAVVLAACGGAEKEIVPNGEIVYNHVNLVVDENDWFGNVGSADYVFIGEVAAKIRNIAAEDFPQSIFSVVVLENLKGNLIKEIEIRLNAGYRKDGTLVLNATDFSAESELPIVSEQYVFLGYAQSNGDILIPEITGFRRFTAGSKEEYMGYIANQVESSRAREKSRFEP